jgi:hypothetical protein
MTVRFDEWQTKSFPEKVGDFDCFLADAMGAAGTLLHLRHEFRFAYYSRTIMRNDGGA